MHIFVRLLNLYYVHSLSLSLIKIQKKLLPNIVCPLISISIDLICKKIEYFGFILHLNDQIQKKTIEKLRWFLAKTSSKQYDILILRFILPPFPIYFFLL